MPSEWITLDSWREATKDMSHRHQGPQQSGRETSAGIVRAHLLEADAERQKRIDRYIDYFGDGGPRRSSVTLDLCGESLLDADGAR